MVEQELRVIVLIHRLKNNHRGFRKCHLDRHSRLQMTQKAGKQLTRELETLEVCIGLKGAVEVDGLVEEGADFEIKGEEDATLDSVD